MYSDLEYWAQGRQEDRQPLRCAHHTQLKHAKSSIIWCGRNVSLSNNQVFIVQSKPQIISPPAASYVVCHSSTSFDIVDSTAHHVNNNTTAAVAQQSMFTPPRHRALNCETGRICHHITLFLRIFFFSVQHRVLRKSRAQFGSVA